jgi:hypothetical protein
MANTKISDLGSRKIALSGLGEIYLPALGDGTAKPGDMVGITDATGRVVRCDIGASELFRGILDDLPTIAEDTAITAALPCSIIVPQPGHQYRVKMEDAGGALTSGQPMGFSDDAGAMEDIAGLGTAGVHAVLTKAIVDDDVVCEIQWIG